MKTKKDKKYRQGTKNSNEFALLNKNKKAVSDWVIALLIFIAILIAAIIAVMKIMRKV